MRSLVRLQLAPLQGRHRDETLPPPALGALRRLRSRRCLAIQWQRKVTNQYKTGWMANTVAVRRR